MESAPTMFLSVQPGNGERPTKSDCSCTPVFALEHDVFQVAEHQMNVGSDAHLLACSDHFSHDAEVILAPPRIQNSRSNCDAICPSLRRNCQMLEDGVPALLVDDRCCRRVRVYGRHDGRVRVYG